MLFARGYYPMPTWRSARGEVDRLRRQMDRVLGSLGQSWEGASPSGLFPPVNLTETEEGYHLTAELPGVEPTDIEISVTGRNISLAGKRSEEPEEGTRYHRRERGMADFSRVIGLPAEVDAEKVEATSSEGILKVSLPKSQAAKARKITVGAG